MRKPPHITVPPPRPTQGPYVVQSAVSRAQALACMVRDESADTIGPYLDRLTADQMYALVVALAAMVPVDATVDELLGWVLQPKAAAA